MFIILAELQDIEADPKSTLEVKTEFNIAETSQVLVPCTEPLIEWQFNASKSIWPLGSRTIHPSTPSFNTVSDTDVEFLEKTMLELITLAKSNEEGQKSAGAILHLPTQRILGISADHRSTHILAHTVPECVKQVVEAQSKNNFEEHLCNAYVYLSTHEPCISCGMALLHSRISMVIYAVPARLYTGALGTLKFHCNKSLNHHFHVYQGFMAEQVNERLGEVDG